MLPGFVSCLLPVGVAQRYRLPAYKRLEGSTCGGKMGVAACWGGKLRARNLGLGTSYSSSFCSAMSSTLPASASERLTARRSTDLISPRAHAIIDRICLPIMLGCALWAARRSKPAAAVLLVNALGEGTIGCLTRFPTGLVPLFSFRTHVRIGQVGGPVFLALSYLLPRYAPAERNTAIFWGVVPIVLNGLSDISGLPRRTA